MKKITIVLIILIGFMFPSSVFAKKFDFGKILDKEIDRQIEVQQKRQQDKERRRRKELDEKSRRKIEEEKNRSRIRQNQERAEELKRREQLKDLKFQQELEIEKERQEKERQLRRQQDGASSINTGINNGDILITLHVYPNNTYQIEGREEIFLSLIDVKEFCTSTFPGKTIRVKEIKH